MTNSEYQELRRFLDQKFGQVDNRFNEVNIRLENMATKQEVIQQFEEAKRYMGILSEDLQRKMDIVVEGHQLLDQKIDNLSQEIKEAIRETQAMIKFSYAELDSRVRALEETVLSLKARMERLEARQR